ncbi:hypothetical protein BWD42_15965 [Sphingobacterium sp. CZ-UAM]|uniref:hypothetical protein n=1 Tax=Sphingobacterium sp. CZ-UAM TaxID=1933868 RepID=UPI000984BAC9|nr:hypothetical protein [Sphingobacterium sp. CZ-UAM]OOG16972.1 hypothetical protein BWD42_15965 [Sphingobacterium sp. CZ-UAM]
MNLQTTFLSILLLGLVSCQQITQSNPRVISTKDSAVDHQNQQITESRHALTPVFDTSTYSNPQTEEMASQQRQQLTKLADAGLFEKFDLKLRADLGEDQKDYFEHHAYLHILAQTKGDIFGNKANDVAYIVYETGKHQIEILFFDQKNKLFKTLYRDIQVSNLLRQSDCYYANGTVDYSIAAELIYQEDYIRSSQSNYLMDENAFSIENISTNNRFDLKRGCLSKDFSTDKMSNTLCMPTSSVYANYQCLKYNKAKAVFELYFSQEFAD